VFCFFTCHLQINTRFWFRFHVIQSSFNFTKHLRGSGSVALPVIDNYGASTKLKCSAVNQCYWVHLIGSPAKTFASIQAFFGITSFQLFVIRMQTIHGEEKAFSFIRFQGRCCCTIWYRVRVSESWHLHLKTHRVPPPGFHRRKTIRHHPRGIFSLTLSGSIRWRC